MKQTQTNNDIHFQCLKKLFPCYQLIRYVFHLFHCGEWGESIIYAQFLSIANLRLSGIARIVDSLLVSLLVCWVANKLACSLVINQVN